MLREEGIVVALEGAYALVANHRKSACGRCHAEASCGALSGDLGKKSVSIRAHNPVHAEVGQKVLLEMEAGQFLRDSFLVYVFPIVAMLLVGLLVQSWTHAWAGESSETFGALAGLGALGLSFYGLRRYNLTIRHDARQQPVIRRIVSCE